MLKYIIVLLFSIPLNLFSVDFDDLKEKKGKYYGSEKEKKIFLDLGIIEIEKWEGHNSVHYLGTPMSMSYPKYKMDNSFPLYYYEKSLVDDRYESNILILSHYSKYSRNKWDYLLFPFLTFGKNEESSYSGVLPFYYYKENNSKNAPSNSLILPGFYRESNKNSSTQISPFHIYNTQKDNNGLVSSTLIMPIFPIYFKDEDELSNHTNFSGIFDFNYDKNINKIDRIWTFPFVFWKRDSYFHIAPVYFSEYSEDETTGSWFGIIPPMYSSNSPNHSTFYAVNYYNNETFDKNGYKDRFTTVFPFFFQSVNNRGKENTTVPLLYYSNTEESGATHKNLVVLYDHAFDDNGKLDRLWISPIFYYNRKSNFYAVPLYFYNENKVGDYTESNQFSLAVPFYHSDSKESTHTNIAGLIDFSYDKNIKKIDRIWTFPFVFWKRDSYLHVVPVFFSEKSNDSTTASWFGIIPPMYSSNSPNHNTFYAVNYYNNESFDKNGNKDRFTTVFPFFFQSVNNRGKENTTVPLLYYSNTEESGATHKNIAVLYDHAFDDNGELDRLWFSPIFFWKRDSYFHIAPVYFSEKSEDKSFRSWFGIIPPMYSSKSPNHSTFYAVNYYNNEIFDKNGYKDRYTTVFPFFFQSANNRGKENTTVPLLYYSNTEESGTTHKNIAILYDHAFDDNGKLDRLWFSPIFYYNRKSNFYAVPLYFYNEDKVGEYNESNQFSFAVPFYHSDSKESTHTNFAGLFDFSYDKNIDKIDRVWTFPFVFWKRDSYLHVVPVFFSEKSNDSTTASWFGIIPPMYSSNSPNHNTFYAVNYYNNESFDKNGNKDRFTTVFPFFFQSANNRGKENTTVPLLYYSNTEESGTTHKNIAVLYDHAFDDNGKLDRLWFSPIFYYNRNSSLFALPLYLSYNREDKESRTDIAFPLYIKKGFSKKEGHTTGLIFNHNWDEEKESLWIANWYSKKDKITGDYFKSFNPGIYKWKSASSKGDIFLPLYITLKSGNKELFHLNIAGIGLKTTNGYLKPDVSLNTGEKDGYKYIDTDLTWFGYLFKISTRTSKKTFINLGENVTGIFVENEGKKEGTKENPKILKHKDFTREDSLDFYGVTALFNGFAYEKGDTKNHVRVFPLFWFTWDDKSKDKFLAWPFPTIVWYEGENGIYNIIVPFYGYQKTETIEREGYGLITYISEKEKDSNLKEKSYLWPITNFYTSDKKSGSRILPLYIYRNIHGEEEDFRSLYSLLAYMNETILDDGTKSTKIVSPFWMYFKEKNKEIEKYSHFTFPIYSYSREINKENEITNLYSPFVFYHSNKKNSLKEKDYSYFLPIPLLYHSYKNEIKESYWNFAAIFSYEKSNHSHNIKAFPIFNQDFYKQDENNFTYTNWFFPLYYSSSTGEKELKSGNIKKENKLLTFLGYYSNSNNESHLSIFPLLYYSFEDYENKENYWTIAGVITSSSNKKQEHFRALPIYYKNSRKWSNTYEEKTSWLFPIYYKNELINKSSETGKSVSSEKIVTPFGQINNKGNSKNYTIYPLGFYSNFSDSETHLNWMLLANYKKTESSKEFSIFPLIGGEKKVVSGKEFSKNYLFPIYFYKSDSTEEGSSEDFISLFYVGEKKKDKNGNIISKSQSFPFIPIGFYREQNEITDHSNLLGIFDYKKENNSLKRLVLFPLWYSKNNHTNNVANLHIFPIYFSKYNNNEYSGFISGLYIEKNESLSNQNFLYLVEHKKESKKDSREIDLLFKSVKLKKEKNRSNFELAYGLASHEKTNDSTKSNILWLAYEKGKEKFLNNLIPLYYYREEKTESELWFSPTLSYSYKTEEEKIKFTGLGAVYYEKDEIKLNKKSKNVALGALYYETSKPEHKGYKGKGSLWGLLWEHQTESETKFEKISVLKFVYTSVTDENGDKYRRIMGVRI